MIWGCSVGIGPASFHCVLIKHVSPGNAEPHLGRVQNNAELGLGVPRHSRLYYDSELGHRDTE